MNKVELLAPAGSVESFYAAINAGADAVYLSGKHFGARAYADNFTNEEIIDCIRTAHLFARKVYLTLNTLVKEDEFELLHNEFLPLYLAGLDGVIVQDLGVLNYLHHNFPDIELHASTQMTITGEYAANYLKKYGVTRIVPARELSLQEIIELKRATDLEIECFIHGSMCYCYSGQCLFSSFLGGRSGNRGRCAQPCRLPYQIAGVNSSDHRQNSSCNGNKKEKDVYPLSLKDLCTIECIDKLIEAGINSFKIEGRMKKPEYVAGVTAIYRKYIDLYYEKKQIHVSKQDMNVLNSLYLRTAKSDGYYFKNNSRDMITMDSPSYNGCNDQVLDEIHRKYVEEKAKLSIELFAKFIVDSPATLTLSCGDCRVTVSGETVQKAIGKPIDEDNVRKQMCKLGDTHFSIARFTLQMEESVFYSLKLMNELRRAGIKQLEKEIINKYGMVYERNVPEQIPYGGQGIKQKSDSFAKNNKHTYTIQVNTINQLHAVISQIEAGVFTDCKRLYIDYSLFIKDKSTLSDLLSEMNQQTDIYIALPYIIRRRGRNLLKDLFAPTLIQQFKIKGYLVRNLEGLALLKANNNRLSIVADSGLYVWNHHALDALKNEINGMIKPLELTRSEKNFFGYYANEIHTEQMIYGHIPMMVTANCVANTAFFCTKESMSYLLADRYHKKFPVQTKCDMCTNIIYNSVPLSLHNVLRKINLNDALLISFTTETEDQVFKVMSYYGNQLHDGPFPFKDFTTGHEKQSVE